MADRRMCPLRDEDGGEERQRKEIQEAGFRDAERGAGKTREGRTNKKSCRCHATNKQTGKEKEGTVGEAEGKEALERKQMRDWTRSMERGCRDQEGRKRGERWGKKRKSQHDVKGDRIETGRRSREEKEQQLLRGGERSGKVSRWPSGERQTAWMHMKGRSASHNISKAQIQTTRRRAFSPAVVTKGRDSILCW